MKPTNQHLPVPFILDTFFNLMVEEGLIFFRLILNQEETRNCEKRPEWWRLKSIASKFPRKGGRGRLESITPQTAKNVRKGARLESTCHRKNKMSERRATPETFWGMANLGLGLPRIAPDCPGLPRIAPDCPGLPCFGLGCPLVSCGTG